MEPMFLSCCIWPRKSVSVKSSPAVTFAAIRSATLLIECLLRLLDEREDVTHVEDAARHPIGVEDLEFFELFAGRREHDRLARDLGDG